MPDTLFSWEALYTLAGASTVTFLIVAYTKRAIDSFWPKILGTDIFVVLVGFLVLLAATAATGQALTWSSVVLALLNGFLVAAASGKMADKTVTEYEKKAAGSGN